MKKTTELFVGRFLYPLIVALIIGMAGSLFFTGSLRNLLQPSLSNVIILMASLILTILGFAIHRRLKRIRSNRFGPMVSVVSTPAFGWMDIGTYTYKGVKWTVQKPAPSPFSSDEGLTLSPNEIEVELPPRCPICGTELEEKKRFLWGHKWFCVGCKFTKVNSESYYTESERVERIIRRDIRNKYKKSK